MVKVPKGFEPVRAKYGVSAVANPASSVNVTTIPGSVILNASKIASEPGQGFSTKIVLVHPLKQDGAVYDLTGLISIDFEFRNTAQITDYFAVSIGSTAYSEAVASAGTVFEAGISGASDLKPGTVWKTASVSVADFATPKWWIDIPKDFPSIENVLMKVKDIRFTPKTTYTDSGMSEGKACAKCANPTMTSQIIEIRRIALVGFEGPGRFNPPSTGCEGSGFALDDAFDDAFDDGVNALGKRWYSYSDFDSTNTSTDVHSGRTVSSQILTEGDSLTSGITIKATLDRRLGGVRHAMAGWAGIGTEIVDSSIFPLHALSGIGFHITAPHPIPQIVEILSFFVDSKGIPDSLAHLARIPAVLLTSAGETFCFRPEHAKQPGSIPESLRTEFEPAKLRGIRWEATLRYNLTSTIDTAVVEFKVSNVRLYANPKVGIVRATKPDRSFEATYRNGILSLKGSNGFERFEIRTLDGRGVASFASADRLGIKLPRGVYMLVGFKTGRSSSRRFTVVGF